MTTTSTPGNRHRMPRGQRRLQLLEAALAAFSERGYHQTLMDDIAERAGVSKPVLYQHFDSKLDLYLALAHEVSAEVVGTLRTALDSTENNADRLTACISTFFDFVDRPGSGFPLLFLSDMVQEPAVGALLEQTRRACGEAIGAEVALASGLPQEEAVLVGMTMAGVAQTAAMHWYANRDTMSKERAITVVQGVAWLGLYGLPAPGEVSTQPTPG